MKDFIRRIRNSSKTLKILWIAAIITIVFVSCMHTYNDILVTGKQGLVFWDILFSGKIFSFYENAKVYSGNPYYPIEQFALYPFLYYVVFAIIELPIWILEKITGANIYNTIPGNIYNKLALLVFVVMDAVALCRILKHLEKDEEEINIFSLLYVTSMIVISSTYITGQYDVVNIYFILMGFYYWLKKDTKRFLIYFAISINLKYFGLMFFVPLLLIDEKNIFRIMGKGIIAVMPTLILMLIFSMGSKGVAGGVGTGVVSMYITKFLVYDISLGNHQFPSFLLISVIACLIAYFYEYKNERERLRLAVFVLLLLIGAFCLIARIIAYWAVLGVPVFMLAIATAENDRNKMLFFEMMLSSALVLYQYFFSNWMFCAKTTSAMGILPRIFGKWPDVENNKGVDGALMSLGFGPEVMDLIYILTFAAWFAMLYYAYPGRKKEKGATVPFDMRLLIFRTVINLGMSLFPFVTAIYIYLVYY